MPDRWAEARELDPGAGSALSSCTHRGPICPLWLPLSALGIKVAWGPWRAGSHTDTPFRAAEFPSPTYSWPPGLPRSAGPRHALFLVMVSRSPDWLQEPSEHLALTQGPLGGRPRGAQASVIGGQVGEEGADVRVPCRGEKEAQRGAPALCRTASGTCALSVPTPPAPEPLPSTVLGPARPPPPMPSAEPRSLRTPRPALGRLGVPWAQRTHKLWTAAVWRPCPLPRARSSTLSAWTCRGASTGLRFPCPVGPLTLALPTQVHLWG